MATKIIEVVPDLRLVVVASTVISDTATLEVASDGSYNNTIGHRNPVVGGTWFVIAAAIVMVLLMAYLANVMVQRKMAPPPVAMMTSVSWVRASMTSRSRSRRSA